MGGGIREEMICSQGHGYAVIVLIPIKSAQIRQSYLCVQIVVVPCRGAALLTTALKELGEAFQCSFPIVIDYLTTRCNLAHLSKMNI